MAVFVSDLSVVTQTCITCTILFAIMILSKIKLLLATYLV